MGRLVANPGCYATAAIVGLAPLLGDGLIEPGSIRVALHPLALPLDKLLEPLP